MANDMNFRRKLTYDVDISAMLAMRQDGMSNKQIACALGVSPTTIYKYIGRKSDAVKVAQMQNRPAGSVIPPQPWEVPASDEILDYKKKQEPQIRRKPRHNGRNTVQADGEPLVVLEGKPFSVYQSSEEHEEAANDQPASVADDHVETQIEEKMVEEMPKEQKKPMLRVVSTRSTLQGSLCKYTVDTESDSIEIDGGGVLAGILDKKTLDDLIGELTEIRSMFLFD